MLNTNETKKKVEMIEVRREEEGTKEVKLNQNGNIQRRIQQKRYDNTTAMNIDC